MSTTSSRSHHGRQFRTDSTTYGASLWLDILSTRYTWGMHLVVNAAARRPRKTLPPAFVRKARLHVGLTQDQLKERLGVSLRTVSRWETTSSCDWPSWLAVIDALNKVLAEREQPLLPTDWTPPDVIVAAPRAKIVRHFGSDGPGSEGVGTLIPEHSLEAAAGAYADQQHPDVSGYLEVEGLPGSPRGTFAGRVAGQSMEPLLHDGDVVVFRKLDGKARSGRVYLVERRDEIDEDTHGHYVVKRLDIVEDNDTTLHRTFMTLVSLNDARGEDGAPLYPPRRVPLGADGYRVVAELVAVLDEAGDG